MTEREIELQAAKGFMEAGLTPISAGYVFSNAQGRWIPVIIYRYDLEEELRAHGEKEGESNG